MLLLAACDRAPGLLADDAPEWLAASAEPVHLTIALDTARARAKQITPRGGTVSATSADGTRFLLRIPPNALLSDAVISLTPVTNVVGLPFENDAFATVQIEPSGLILQKPGILTIRPRDEEAIPLAAQVAFGYFGSGDDAHLVPILPNERGDIQLPVAHFSGYGWGRAAPDDPGRIALQKAEASAARLSARVAELLSRERRQQLLGIDENIDWNEAGIEPAVEYYDAVIEPLLEAALGNEALARCAMQWYLTWERQMQLLGLGSEGSDMVPDAASASTPLAQRRARGHELWIRVMTESTRKLIDNAIERCRNEHDFSAANVILSLQRQLLLLGVASEDSGLADIHGWDRMEDCYHFEVEFRSVIDMKRPTGGTYFHVLAKVPFAVWSAEPQTAPIDYVAFHTSGNAMRDLFGAGPLMTPIGDLAQMGEATIAPAGTKPGVARVVAIQFDLNPWVTEITDCSGEDARTLRQRAMHFRVLFDPGLPTEIVRNTYVHEGEQVQIAAVAQAFMEGLGADASELDSARVPGPMTTEEHAWAEQWFRLHAEQLVDSLSGLARSEQLGGVYRIPLDSLVDARGVWRADFKNVEPEFHGFSQTESGYLILRHTPR